MQPRIKKIVKKLLSLMILARMGFIIADTTPASSPRFISRSQGTNAARELVMWQDEINRCDAQCFYTSAKAAVEFTRSFKDTHITEALFGNSITMVNKKSTFNVSGATTAQRIGNKDFLPESPKEWLADYFGLPSDFTSTIALEPLIANFMVDFNVFFGLDQWKKGVYVRVNAPLVHTSWSLNILETVTAAGTAGYEPGYMSKTEITRDTLAPNFVTALQGYTTWGDMQTPLKYGKLPSKRTDGGLTRKLEHLAETRFADIEMVLGWNFWLEHDYHLGINLRGSAPTGTRPTSTYLFEPQIGNNKHWEFGAGLSGHAILWRGCEHDNYVGIYADANFTHLCTTKQTRSFDFKNNPNSRYMLLAEFKTPVNTLRTIDALTANYTLSTPSHQYAGNLIPAINLTTFDVNTSIAFQGDIAFKLAYISEGLSIDLGYNLWARTGEKFGLRGGNHDGTGLARNTYVFKSNSRLYGWAGEIDPVTRTTFYLDPVTIVPRSNSQSGATIYHGAPLDNPKIGSHNLPVQSGFCPVLFYLPDNPLTFNTSQDPIFISMQDIDMSKGPSAYSHKIFGNLGYTWLNKSSCNDWIAYFGIGGEGEFAGHSKYHAALSQWGFWVQGGISFN